MNNFSTGKYTAFFKVISDRLFSTSAAGAYLLIFAVAIGVATFIENDYGTSAAQQLVFKTKWFELLLILFGITLIVNVFRFRLIQQKKWATLTFHLSMVIIILGAGVTRYFGYEGVMGIREGEQSNSFLSAETYLTFEAEQGGKRFRFHEPVLFSSFGKNNFDQRFKLGNDEIRVQLTQLIPNPTEAIEESEAGIPILKVVIGSASGREEIPLRMGERGNIYGTLFNFGNAESAGAFNIKYENNNLLFKADRPYQQMVMATQQRDSLPAGQWHPLMLRSLYNDGEHSFVFGDFKPKATVSIQSAKRKIESNSKVALQMLVTANGQPPEELVLVGQQGVEGAPRPIQAGNTQLAISYGAKRVTLPFSLKLRDFILEKYPGTDNASSYASEVTLVDPRDNKQENFRIFMNNILDYDGYRFFQSSFDPDELGTYLSVNHDFWGTWISYLGYILLTIGMVLVLFDKKSRFQRLSENLKNMRNSGNTFILLLIAMLGAMPISAQHTTPPFTIPADHAAMFGKLAVQDYKGRCKPMNTYSSEILRKLSRKEHLYGMNADQIVLAMMLSPKDWYNVPLIKLGKHEELTKVINSRGDLAAYNDFFDEKGDYKLRDQARAAYNKPPRDRGVFEKEVIKLDEKLNICSMVFSGDFMKMFPLPGDPNNNWATPESNHEHEITANSPFHHKFYPAYLITMGQAIQNNDWELPNKLLHELDQYQRNNGAAVRPSDSKTNAEILLNKMNVFNRLGMVYGLLGLAFLSLLFIMVFKPGARLRWWYLGALGVLAVAFLMHTIGLGLRWYVSGRAPWSNGYESMIYIGWTTTLAGLIFTRKSPGGLAATSILAATIMMVAMLSFLDPEITPLVPVLNSYWLTIHVSLEAGSYGFLVLGAIIAIINLILIVVGTRKHQENIYRMVKELSQISEMTVTGGLIMLSIGTYLGGVWANESWGRYWGWDAKETWALVSILVYAFILHMRFIPGLRGFFAYNVANLFGWASVMMTYYGVNYYLSGLHSYAAGDPVPIPDWVYYGVISLTVLSVVAYWKHRRNNSGNNSTAGRSDASLEAA